jgi:DNA-binding transcriptional ArsR family regulator
MPGKIYDFAMGLVFAFNDNYTDDYSDFNLTPDKNVEEALDRIKRRVTFGFKGLELFLDPKTPVIEAFVYNEDLWRNKSIEEYIEYIRNFDERMSVTKVLKYLNDNNDINESILSNNDSAINFINGLEVSSSLKWEVFQFIQSPALYMKGLGSFLDDYLKIYNNIMVEFDEEIKGFNKYVENNLKEMGSSFLKDLTMRKLELSNEDLYVTAMFFNSHSFIVNHREDGVYFLVGIDCEETIKKLYGEGEIESNVNIFKSLSDNTRFEILRLISQKEMYGQEIAEKVGITMASITYHMNFLIGTNIVKVQPVGRKIYYSINKDTLKKSIGFLNKIFNM